MFLISTTLTFQNSKHIIINILRCVLLDTTTIISCLVRYKHVIQLFYNCVRQGAILYPSVLSNV